MVAPCSVPGCSKEDVKKKEVKVFDRVMKEICEDYLDKFTFDDHPVAVRMIPCEEKQHQSFGKRQAIETFLKAPLRSIYAGHHKELQEQFKDLLGHVDRRKCEVTFMKCMNCHECCKNEIKAKKSMGFLDKHGKRHPEVLISEDPSHYMTYLQQSALEGELQTPDAGLPSSERKDQGRCETCKSWSFNSKTEKERHQKVFHHGRTTKSKQVTNGARTTAEAHGKPEKTHTCKHKVDGKECGLHFTSYHQLCMHKNLVGHKRKSNAKNEDETRYSRQKRVRTFNQNLDAFLVQAAAERSTSSSDEDTIEDRGNANQSVEEEMTVNGKENEQEDEDTACTFCGKLEPENYEAEEIDWIFCTKCKPWFHQKCMGIDDNNLPKKFLCFECRN